MKKLPIILLSLVAITALVYIAFPTGEDAAERLDQAGAGEAKVVAPAPAAGESIGLLLNVENTQIGFSCAKEVAGKTLTVHGGWNDQIGGKLEGTLHLNPKSKKPLRLEVVIDVASLWSEHDMLTEALLTKGFFQAEEHPTASFVSTSIEQRVDDNQAMQDATHRIEGNLSINGIEKSISFPARITVEGTDLALISEFSLNRKDFDMIFQETAGLGLLTDEDISDLVAMKIKVEGSWEGKIASSQASSEPPDDGAPAVGGAGDTAAAKLATIDASKLAKSFSETIPATQIGFDMVLVPGDSEKGIAPFYLGKHEVTWDEFMPWADCSDIEVEDDKGEQRALKLRPSPPYGAVDRGFGMDRRPALGMSWLSADLYCKWLSKQTGKTYRLPTEQEWEHAYALGGGNLSEEMTADDAGKKAVYDDNSWDDYINDYATKPVGSMEASTLGIHDMAGNVCEWVTDTGDDRVARGGHFEVLLPSLGTGRDIEDNDVWNLRYPNEPKSIWWYVDARWVGFRVVCETEGE